MLEGLAIATGAKLGELALNQLLDLGKDALEDYVKDFFKECIDSGVTAAHAKVLEQPMGEAVGVFVQKFIEELQFHEVPDTSIDHHYKRLLKGYVKSPSVRSLLGKAFKKGCKQIDYEQLQTIWMAEDSVVGLQFPAEDFNWPVVTRAYVQAVKVIVKGNVELRALLEVELSQDTAEATRQIAGLPVPFNLKGYREAILEQYGSLQLDSLGSSKYEREGVNYRTVPLWGVFVAQDVRECQTYVPQNEEIPKEEKRRLQQEGDLEAIDEAEAETYRKQYFQQPVQSVFELMGVAEGTEIVQPRNPNTVILGDPGSGKSTLLRYLAVNWARYGTEKQIPLLIELRGYIQSRDEDGCRDFVDFVHRGSNWVGHLEQGQVDQFLEQGQVLVMFDGLDEVVERQQRGTVLKQIHNFSQRYPQVPIVVTSRVIGYNPTALRDADFQHFMLQDLSASQIEYFIQRWHQLTYSIETDRQHKQTRLQRAIQNSQAIQELAGNPLLLTLMAILNRGEELPRDRVRLYEKASEVLLYQWDVEAKFLKDPRLEKYPIEIDHRDKQAMLRRVAAAMQNSEKGLAGNFIRRVDLETCLIDYLKTKSYAHMAPNIAVVMIDQLRERNFILCSLGADNYAFVHRTFLEYFCATEIKERFDKRGKAGGLEFEDLQNKVFGRHWQDETWHEVLRLITGMIGDEFACDLIQWLMNQKINRFEHLEDNPGRMFASQDRQQKQGLMNLLLAADCLGEVREKTALKNVSITLLAYLKHEVEVEYPFLFTAETAGAMVNAIANNSQDNIKDLAWLKRCTEFSNSSYVPESAVSAISQTCSREPGILVWLKDNTQSHFNFKVRFASVQELARVWKDDPEILAWLKLRAQSDQDSAVRRASVQELARVWKDDPETLAIVKHLAQSDQDSAVRRASVQELARVWKEDPETLAIVKHLAQSDQHYNVRLASIEELVRFWKEDPEILSIVKHRAQADQSYHVRRASVEALARGWKEDPEILAWLKHLAQVDQDSDVRLASVQQLARGWKDDPETLAIVKHRTQADQHYNVRLASVQQLARVWKDNPETLAIVKHRAQADQHYNVRLALVQELARAWKDAPETLAIVKHRAQADQHYNVRLVSVQELARGWKDDPETLAIVKHRAQADQHYNVRLASVQELARGWKDDPETLAIVKHRGQADPSSDVRRASVQELARGWKDDPETLAWLKHRAQTDQNYNVRLASVQELARGWKDDLETLAIVKHRAQADPSSDVRRASVQELARGWKDDPETLAIAKHRAQVDPSSDVRRVSVRELARGWKDDPGTLAIIKHRAQADPSSDVRRASVRELARGWKDDLGTLAWLKDFTKRGVI